MRHMISVLRSFALACSVVCMAGILGCGGSSSTSAASGPLATAPIITGQPAALQVAPGSAASFSCATTGVPTPSYQWYRSNDAGLTWTAIAGATSTTYILASPALTDTGAQFRMSAVNTYGSATSLEATLTVVVPTAAPAFTTQPASVTVAAGSPATFAAFATGTPAPTYQWSESIDGGSTWTALAGATSATLTLASPAVSDSGDLFKVTATNSQTSTTSQTAVLTVKPGGTTAAPAILVQPVSVAVLAGSPATFAVTASGNPAPTYLWSRSNDNGATWAPLAGATAAAYTVAAPALGDSGAQFQVTLASSVGTVTSLPAILTVSTASAANAAPAITTQPTSQSVLVGSPATFVVAASGSPAPTYQWSRSSDGGSTWTALGGATGSAYTLAAPTLADSGAQFRAVAANVVSSATSQAATLTVSVATQPNAAPAITSQPASQTVLVGSAATFAAGASGTPVPTDQWYRSNDGGTTWTALAGATSPTYILASPALADSGALFRFLATNSQGSATSQPASLTVNAIKVGPAFATQPAPLTVPVGTAASFSATASGNPAPTYQWSRSNDAGKTWTAIPGATATTYTLASPSTSDNGALLQVAASNSQGNATSASALLTVTAVAGATTSSSLAPQSAPLGIATGPDGNIWFTNQSQGQIGLIQSISGQVLTMNLPDTTCQPTGITAGPDGQMWFTELAKAKVGSINLQGTSIHEFGAGGLQPTAIATGPDGNLWYTLQGSNLIGQMSPSGASATFTVNTAGAGPVGIALGKDGNVWFTEGSVGQIARITPSGLQTEWVIPTPANGVKPVPQGIVASADGSLWVADSANGQVVKFSPTKAGAVGSAVRRVAQAETAQAGASSVASPGLARPAAIVNLAAFSSTGLGQGSSPHGLTVDADDNLWVADRGLGAVVQLSTGGGGSVMNTYPVPASSTLTNVAMGTNGNLYVTVPGSSAITQVVAQSTQASVGIGVTPTSAQVATGQTVQFLPEVTGTTNLAATWTIQEGTSGGTVSSTGLYTAPGKAGTYHVVATSVADPTQTCTATVTVYAPVVVAPIASFSAASPAVGAGSSTTLMPVFNTGTGMVDQGIGAVTSGVPVTVGPLSASTTYTLTVTTTGGITETVQCTVSVVTTTGLPVISGFAASPSSVGVGAGAVLSWTVSGATSVAINNGVGTVSATSGSANVAPALSTVYTLSATNGGGTVTANATVAVDASPFMITGFTANDPVVPFGGSTALNWTYAGLPVSFTLNGSPVTGSTQTVSPVGRTTYTLAGANANGSGTRSLKVGAQGLDLVAGNAIGFGHQDGKGTAASFFLINGLAADGSGNLYASDCLNSTLRKIDPSGNVTTVAGMVGKPGSVDGPGASAQFQFPWGLAADAAGNVYIGDRWNSVVRKLDTTGNVTTVAGTAGQFGSSDSPGATFGWPSQVAVDAAGNLYISDTYFHTIRKRDTSGTVTTIAGQAGTSGYVNGPTPTSSTFTSPEGLAFDAAGNLYVAEAGDIRVITQAGAVGTLAGQPNLGFTNATGTAAQFRKLRSLVLDGAGNLYVADPGNKAVRMVVIATGGVTTLATPSGVEPFALAWVIGRGLAFGDATQSLLYVGPPAGPFTLVAGTPFVQGSADGAGSAATFNVPSGACVDTGGNAYVTDGNNHTIRKVTAGGLVTTLAGSPGKVGLSDGQGSTARFNTPGPITIDTAGNLYVADDGTGAIRKVTPAGYVTTLANLGNSTYINGLAVDVDGNVYVADSNNNRIFKIYANSNNYVGQILGFNGAGYLDGPASTAKVNGVSGIAVDGNGNLYLADYGNFAIRRLALTTNTVTTVAGNPGVGQQSRDGLGTSAYFTGPFNLALDSSGNLYVLDGVYADFPVSIRKVTPAGLVTTVAGQPYYGGWMGAGALSNPLPVSYGTSMGITTDGDLIIPVNNGLLRVTAPALAGAPAIATQPQSQIGTLGQPAVFSVVPSGLAPFTYQWSVNGAAIGGATTATYVTPPLTAAYAGNIYTVIVGNAGGSVASTPATLSLISAQAPVIGLQPLSAQVAVGETTTLQVTSSATTPTTFQWFDNGVAIAGATGSSYEVPNATLGANGSVYTVAVTDAAGTTTSGPATLTVVPGGMTQAQAIAQAKSSLNVLMNATGNLGSSFFPTQASTVQTDLAGTDLTFGVFGRDLTWMITSIQQLQAQIASAGGKTLTAPFNTGSYGSGGSKTYAATLTQTSPTAYSYSITGGADGSWTGTVSNVSQWSDGSLKSVVLTNCYFPGDLAYVVNATYPSGGYTPAYTDLMNVTLATSADPLAGSDQAASGTITRTAIGASTPVSTFVMNAPTTWTQAASGQAPGVPWVLLPHHLDLTIAFATYSFTGTADFGGYQANPTAASAVSDGPSFGWHALAADGTTFTNVAFNGAVTDGNGSALAASFTFNIGNYASLNLDQPLSPTNAPAVQLAFTGSLQAVNQPLLSLNLQSANQGIYQIPMDLTLSYGTTVLKGSGTAYPIIAGQPSSLAFYADIKDQTGIDFTFEKLVNASSGGNGSAYLTGTVSYCGTVIGTISDQGLGLMVTFIDGTFQSLYSGGGTGSSPGGTSSSPAVNLVIVNPNAVTVLQGGSQPFTAAVVGANLPSQQVTWSALHGTITSSGLYTAPASGSADTVTATSVLNPLVSGSAAVTLSVPAIVAAVAVAPAATTVGLGGSQQFTATVTGSNNPWQAVNWSALHGTITPTGLYTAPASGATDTVTATSAVNPGVSATAQITLSTLSEDQVLLERFSLAPNLVYTLGMGLPATGQPKAGTSWVTEFHGSVPASPSTGPQTVQFSTLADLTRSSLGIPPVTAASSPLVPDRVLLGGAIVVSSNTPMLRFVESYVGPSIRVDYLDVSGTTTVYSRLRSGYSLNALGGTVAGGTPLEFQHYWPNLFANPLLLNPGATWGSGAAYLKFSQTQVGDVYYVLDAGSVKTTGTTPVPAAPGNSVSTAITGTVGFQADGTTYTLANGTISVINGVNTYVASVPIPNKTTLTYRTYFDLNGNIYTGNLVKNGTVVGGSVYTVNGTAYYDENYSILVNAAAAASLKSALTF